MLLTWLYLDEQSRDSSNKLSDQSRLGGVFEALLDVLVGKQSCRRHVDVDASNDEIGLKCAFSSLDFFASTSSTILHS